MMFCLVVDDFGVERAGKDHVKHLANTLNSNHDVTKDWTGENCLGIDLDWDYLKRTVRLPTKQRVRDSLMKRNHPVQNKPYHSPHTNKLPTLGVKTQ